MATLENTKIKNTYDALLKLGDNQPLIANRKAVQDGTGQNSGISINNAGEVRITNRLIVGNDIDAASGTYSRTLVVGRLHTLGSSFNSIDSIICGEDNTHSGDNSLTCGDRNFSEGSNGITGGLQNATFSGESIAVGNANSLYSGRAIVCGVSNEAASLNGITLGSNNQNYASNSIVGGNNNENQSSDSILMGYNNINYGSSSILVGRDLGTGYTNTALFGRGHSVNDTNTLVCGQYSENTTGIFRVGVGTSTTNRKNALEIYKDTFGNVVFNTLLNSASYADDAAADAGGVKVGGLYRNGNDIKIRLS